MQDARVVVFYLLFRVVVAVAVVGRMFFLWLVLRYFVANEY
ncbi:hypothetical protein PP707_01085 [Acetobacter pasteurianus]|nr:hypothetical protein [Acetobacter pasteurianus]